MSFSFDPLWPWSSALTALAAAGSQALIAVFLAAAILFALPILLHFRPSPEGRRRVFKGVGIALAVLFAWVMLRSWDSSGSLFARVSGLGMSLFILVPFGLAGITVWSYLGIPGATSRRIAAVLALRLAAYFLILLGVSRPSVTFERPDKQREVLLLVADASESMTILDEFDNQSRWNYLLRNLKEASPVLQKLRDAGVDVAFHRFAENINPFDPDEPGNADGKRTDIGFALHRLIDELKGDRPVVALFLLSDGADNGLRYPALDEAARVRRRKDPFPIHTVGFGKTTTRDVQKDVAVRELVPLKDGMPIDEAIPIKSELTVGVRVDAPGFKDSPARIKLFLDGKEVKAQDVVLRLEEGNYYEIKTTAPSTPGEVKLTVRVEDPQRPGEPLPGQVSKLKNEMSTYLSVTKQGMSVLLIDKPRAFEPQAICDALTDLPRIRLYPVWLRGDQPDPEAADLFQFDKQQYDVIIIGDVTAAQMRAVRSDALEAIEKQVSKGAGLLMIGGYSTFGNSDWKGTPIEALLPVLLEARGQKEGDVKMVPTTAGMKDFSYILRLGNTTGDLRAAWKELPPLSGMTLLGKPKPNVGTVLAAAGTETGEPLLVGRIYSGTGRVLAFAGDTTEHWSRSPETFKYHRAFWQRMVRWLAKQEEDESQAWIKPNTRRLPMHHDLNFKVGLRSKGGIDIPDAKYTVNVVGPDGKRFDVLVNEKGQGVFKNATLPGEYRIELNARGKGPEGEEAPPTVSARFMVYDDEIELTRRAADHEFLRKLATVGGGQFMRAEKLTEFLEKLAASPRDLTRARGETWPDWRTREPSAFLVGYFLLFVALIGGEWFLRRRWGWV